MNKMAKVFGLGKWLVVLSVAACGGNISENPQHGKPQPAECTVNCGVCSYAHEPATMDCPANFADVVRCTSPESLPMPECVASLSSNPSIWCCPGASDFGSAGSPG